jgi:allantoate deiminase
LTNPMTTAATERRDVDFLADETLARCDVLAAESEATDALTRTFLSPPMRRVHEHVAAWMRRAGLAVRLDAAGNLIGRREGADSNAPAVAIGSHLDTVPNAGRFDGILGVLLGIAAAELLDDAVLPFAIEVIGFSEEEGVRYQSPFLGSLAYCGRFDRVLLDRADADGVTMAEAFRRFGLDPARIGEAARPPGSIAAYVEAHIEQGPMLDDWELPVGIVEAIAGQSRLWLTFDGEAGHAGTTPMDRRRDPLPASAEFVLEVERLGRSIDGLRATVGAIVAAPGASNVIPSAVSLSLDVRHAVDATRERAVEDLLGFARATAVRRGIGLRVEGREDHRAVPADLRLTELLGSIVRAVGYESRLMVSGAGHDAAVMASLAPMAMLFVRSPGGVSHHPAESVRRGDVAVALDVLVRFLIDLAGPPNGVS